MKPEEPITAGWYARKQIGSPSALISWSHRRRFATGLALAQRFRGGRLLDYGCGDGTFLALLMTLPDRPSAAVGAELTATMVDDCQRRLGSTPGLTFVTIDTLRESQYRNAFDGIVCMEVLEHVTNLDAVLADFERVLAPPGTLIVSVPVETGPPVLVKQTTRWLLGRLGVGDYPGTTSYGWGELARATVAGKRQHLQRPVHQTPTGPAHDHKGFNWRLLREHLAARFDLEALATSPIRWLPPLFASQVWLTTRARAHR